MNLNFMWIKKLWKALRKDSTLEQKSVTLLDLNEDCLRHIGYYLSIEDTYSLGHTCRQLFGTVSKIRAIVTITDPNGLKYLNYFGQEAWTIEVNTEDTTQEFNENKEKHLLAMMEKCRKISRLNLITSNARILESGFVSRSIRKLAHLRICLMDLAIFYRPNFVESMKTCENLRGLIIEYDAKPSSSHTVKEIFATEFPKLESVFLCARNFNNIFDDNSCLVPLNTFLRHNCQIKYLEIFGPLFKEYLEAIVFCQNLEAVELSIFPMAEELIPKLLIINELPLLCYTILNINIHVSEQMAPILRQIQSLKELSIICTLFEDFIDDILQIPQITSLTLKISLFPCTIVSEIIDQLRYHEQSLYNLTNLHLFRVPMDKNVYCWTTINGLNEFIKFIINCPRIESIELPSTFPICRFYKQLLKYDKNFGYHARKKALHLTVVNIQWIPGYSNGRRTHNVIIKNKYGDEPDSSISRIIQYAYMELVSEVPSLLLCLFCMLIGKLIHVIQNLFIQNHGIC